MNELIAVAAITILAVISPGPDFAMIIRNSYALGARTGLISALGIGFGVQIHVMYTILGIAVIIVSSPILFMAMKALGAGYLIHLGYKSLTNKTSLELGHTPGRALSPFAAFRMGFLTNAFNPKTMLFVVATYTQVVRADSSVAHNFAYGLFMSISHWIWFSIVALFFSTPAMRRSLLAQQNLVDKVIGVALIALGASLGFTNTGGSMRVVCIDLEGVLTPEIWPRIGQACDTLLLFSQRLVREPDYPLLMQQRICYLQDNGLRLSDLQAIVGGISLYPEARSFFQKLSITRRYRSFWTALINAPLARISI